MAKMGDRFQEGTHEWAIREARERARRERKRTCEIDVGGLGITDCGEKKKLINSALAEHREGLKRRGYFYTAKKVETLRKQIDREVR